jgi:hypothetical protein
MGAEKPKRLKRTLIKPTPYSEGAGESSRDIVPLTPSLVNVNALPRFFAGADQRFEDVVDLHALPIDLQPIVLKKAPFLRGFRNAQYDLQLFSEVAGLCSSGPHPCLGVSNKMMPLKEMHPDWKPARYESRITLAQVDNEELKAKYEGLYCRVYGGKPDKNMPVNWAQLAMEIWAGRYKDP